MRLVQHNFFCSHISLLLLLSVSITPISVVGQIFYDGGRQISGSDSIANGNPNALFINPAFLGQVSGKHFTGQILQAGFNGYSDFLNRNEVSAFTFSSDSIETGEKFDWLQIVEEQPIDFDLDVIMTWISGSFASPTFGGLAISITDRINGNFLLGREMTDLLLNGTDADWLSTADTGERIALPTSLNGDELVYRHIRELQTGYGRRIIQIGESAIYGGISFSYLWGIGFMKLQSSNGMVSGASAFSRLYDISYGSLGGNFGELTQQILDHSGTGYSLGLGASIVIDKTLMIGASVRNLGNLTWTKQLVTTETDSLYVHPNIKDGIGTFKWSKETDLIYDAFNFSAASQIQEELAPVYRINALWKARRDLVLSSDIMYLVHDPQLSESSINIMIGASYRPFFGLVNVSTAVLYNSTFGFRWPLGIAGNFGQNNTIVSISTNDVITLLRNKENPLSSLTIATLTQRF